MGPRRSLLGLFTGFTVWLISNVAANAHPHVLVTASAELVFNTQGQVAEIRQSWTFDEMYTAFAITGFGSEAAQPSAAQLKDIARQNIEDMGDYKYFTVLKSGREQALFVKPKDYSADLVKTKDDLSLVLHFLLPLKTPLAVPQEATLQVYDPSYFVAFSFADGGVTLSGNSGACRNREVKAKPLDSIDQQSLSESFFTNMLPGTDFGIKLADRIFIDCR